MNNYEDEQNQTDEYYSQLPAPQMPGGMNPQYEQAMQENKVANFISQTSPTQTVIKVDKILRGFVFDDEKQGWVKVTQSIPDRVRMDFLQVMTPHLTEDVRMTRLDQKTINNIMTFAIEWTVDYLDIVADEEGLSEEQMTKIALMMWSAVFYTLSRSVNGVERDRVYSVLKLGDNFSDYGKQEEKRGVLSSLLPWK